MELDDILWFEIILCATFGLFYFLLSTKRSSTNVHTSYSVKEWNFHLKRLWALFKIKIWRKKKDTIKIENETEEKIYINENEDFDSKSFWGVDSKGTSVYISFVKNLNRTSEIGIILKLEDGTTYRMPNQPDTVIFDASTKTWNAGNLRLTVLEPFRRWRIVFNGILAKGNKKEWNSDPDDLIHVRFNFIWIAASKPVRLIDDSSDDLLAEAIARVPWKNSDWFDAIKKYPVKGYDQYGCLFGTVKLEGIQEPIELYLHGIRQRRLGLCYQSFVRRTLNVTGMTSDGTFYNINIQTMKNGLSHLSFGSVRLPNSNTYPITWTDLDISEIGEYQSHIRKAFNIQFKAGGKKFTSSVYLIDTNTNLLRSGAAWEWENIIIPFQGSINSYQGYGILQLGYKYTGNNPTRHFSETKQLQPLDIEDINTEKICATFKDKTALCPQFVGAKASSLALLSSVQSDDYKVPNGFCLTTKALQQQLVFNECLSNAVQAIEKVNENYDESKLKTTCDRVTELFTKTPLCRPVAEVVSKYIFELLNSEKVKSVDEPYFAVRSSGIGEDSEELSAAGQNATILGCKSPEEIFTAVQKCWASLFTFQSVEYRRQHGQPVNCGMGVVVQTMVNAEAAGVMFTRDPMTGNPSSILITSNYGIGESVVSGSVEPDTIYLKKSLDNTLKLDKIEIGKKTHKMIIDKTIINSDSRLKTSELIDDSSKVSINEEQCLKLGRIAVKQETLWGSPRDIEWCIVDDEVYLVQARPITTLHAWSEFELVHELDAPVMTDHDLLTFANTGEVLPGTYSPLSYSTFGEYLDKSLRHVTKSSLDFYFYHCLISTHFHVGLSALNTIFKQLSKEIDISNKVLDTCIFGRPVLDEKIHSYAIHRNGALSSFETVKEIANAVKLLWQNNSNAKKSTKISNSFDIDFKDCKTSLEMLKKIEDSLPIILDICMLHNKCTQISTFTQLILMRILLGDNTDITTEYYSDVAMILSSCSNVISADVPTSLNNLSNCIRKSNKAEEFSQLKPEEAIKWLKMNFNEGYDKFNEFLAKHGHRSIKEFDMHTDTWEIDQIGLVITLQASLKSLPAEEQKNDNVDVLSKLTSNVKNSTKKILSFIIPMCQKSVSNREQTKSSLIYLVHKFRLAYRKLAMQMVKEWKIPDMKLIFFMTRFELNNYLEDGNPDIINKAVLRRRFFQKWNDYQFAELCWGIPKPLNSNDMSEVNITDSVVNGTPVYSGNVIGRACVIRHLSEIGQLQKGDILITHSTDIGWSPYFPLLNGVVTELGGLISHGAVVAREYGLPCIISAQNATYVFKTGDKVMLNATKGFICKIEDSVDL